MKRHRIQPFILVNRIIIGENFCLTKTERNPITQEAIILTLGRKRRITGHIQGIHKEPPKTKPGGVRDSKQVINLKAKATPPVPRPALARPPAAPEGIFLVKLFLEELITIMGSPMDGTYRRSKRRREGGRRDKERHRGSGTPHNKDSPQHRHQWNFCPARRHER